MRILLIPPSTPPPDLVVNGEPSSPTVLIWLAQGAETGIEEAQEGSAIGELPRSSTVREKSENSTNE